MYWFFVQNFVIFFKKKISKESEWKHIFLTTVRDSKKEKKKVKMNVTNKDVNVGKCNHLEKIISKNKLNILTKRFYRTMNPYLEWTKNRKHGKKWNNIKRIAFRFFFSLKRGGSGGKGSAAVYKKTKHNQPLKWIIFRCQLTNRLHLPDAEATSKMPHFDTSD